MALSLLWTGMVVVSIVYGVLSGSVEAVGKAAVEGASEAVKLCIGICGVTSLWTGVMEILSRAGVTAQLKNLFPGSKNNAAAMEAVSANVAANLLGLGNAATPLGIKAASEMARGARNGVATDDLCMLVVLNSASIQLIPATVAAVRAAAGAQNPFDILPAVWLASGVSVLTGILMAKIMARLWRSSP